MTLSRLTSILGLIGAVGTGLSMAISGDPVTGFGIIFASVSSLTSSVLKTGGAG